MEERDKKTRDHMWEAHNAGEVQEGPLLCGRGQEGSSETSEGDSGWVDVIQAEK